MVNGGNDMSDCRENVGKRAPRKKGQQMVSSRITIEHKTKKNQSEIKVHSLLGRRPPSILELFGDETILSSSDCIRLEIFFIGFDI